jgi:uncharacterized protein (DUF488 family)
MNTTIFSVGHGNRSIEAFVDILKTYQIDYLVDIRSVPRSKYCPHFNQEELKKSVENQAMTYVYFGHLLGGRPKDPTVLTEEGKVNFELLKKTDYFQKGIERLTIAAAKNIRLAIMCAESKPHECHRSKWVAEALSAQQIEVLHINETAELEEHQSVIQKVIANRLKN